MADSKKERGYVKFTGDYSKLKSMGFTFQKLFAGNYMQWHRNHFRVWKRGAELEHSNFNLFKLISFMRTKPELGETTFLDGSHRFVFYKMYYATEYNDYDYDYHPYDEEHRQQMKEYNKAVSEHREGDDFPEPVGDLVFVGKKQMDVLKEFEDLGWYELAYWPEE